jgi:hypothetical protein
MSMKPGATTALEASITSASSGGLDDAAAADEERLHDR